MHHWTSQITTNLLSPKDFGESLVRSLQIHLYFYGRHERMVSPRGCSGADAGYIGVNPGQTLIDMPCMTNGAPCGYQLLYKTRKASLKFRFKLSFNPFWSFFDILKLERRLKQRITFPAVAVVLLMLLAWTFTRQANTHVHQHHVVSTTTAATFQCEPSCQLPQPLSSHLTKAGATQTETSSLLK